MPTYDVECSECGFASDIVLRLADLDDWDQSSVCPKCEGKDGAYRRVIKQAPRGQVRAHTLKDKMKSNNEQFVKSGGRDDLRHAASKRENKDQQAEAREIVRHGLYEGF